MVNCLYCTVIDKSENVIIKVLITNPLVPGCLFMCKTQ